jgi:hypothetical protein
MTWAGYRHTELALESLTLGAAPLPEGMLPGYLRG